MHKPAVGDIIRVDHGDKVTERYVTNVGPTLIRTEARHISGVPWDWGGRGPHKFVWDCSPDQWVRLIGAYRTQGKLVEVRYGEAVEA